MIAMSRLTRAEWDRLKHQGRTCLIGGQTYALLLDRTTQATVLVPVTVSR